MGKLPLFLYETEVFTKDLKAKIEEAAAQAAEKYGQELVEVVTDSNSKGPVLRITVGSRQGPTIADLTAITKELKKLEAGTSEKLIPPDFQLEVSSPGIDRELKNFRDFYWNEGRTLKLKVTDGEVNSNIEGELLKASEDSILISSDGEEKKIFYKDILKAKIKIKF